MTFQEMKSHDVPPTLAEIVFVVLSRPEFLDTVVRTYIDVKQSMVLLSESITGNETNAIADFVSNASILFPAGIGRGIRVQKENAARASSVSVPMKGGRGFPVTMKGFLDALRLDETLYTSDKKLGGGNAQILYETECVPKLLDKNAPTDLNTLYTYRLIPTIDEWIVLFTTDEFMDKVCDKIALSMRSFRKPFSKLGKTSVSSASSVLQKMRAPVFSTQLNTSDKNVFPGESSLAGLNGGDLGKCASTDMFDENCIGDYETMKQLDVVPTLRMWILLFTNPVFLLNVRTKLMELVAAYESNNTYVLEKWGFGRSTWSSSTSASSSDASLTEFKMDPIGEKILKSCVRLMNAFEG